MDLSFSRRAQRRSPAGTAARMDYGMLVATLDAMRAATRPMAGVPFGAAAGQMSHPLVELLLGGPSWREAAVAQGGSFNRAQAQALSAASGG